MPYPHPSLPKAVERTGPEVLKAGKLASPGILIGCSSQEGGWDLIWAAE